MPRPGCEVDFDHAEEMAGDDIDDLSPHDGNRFRLRGSNFGPLVRARGMCLSFHHWSDRWV
jgi:hypothetical protein